MLVLTGLLLIDEDEAALRYYGAELLLKGQPMHRVIDRLKQMIPQ